MTTENTSYSLTTFPFLTEEMERTLRLLAWKDEIFREALIANPKGVIQHLFPQCFPNGQLPDQLTIKVIEEDPDICHIVLPFLPEELEAPEIPEEEQLKLLANMGSDRGLERKDSSERHESQSSEKSKFDFMKQHYEKKQQATSESLTREKIQSLAGKDTEFSQKLKEASRETASEKRQEMLIKTLQEYFPHHFSNGSNLSERQTFEVTQDTPDTHHIVLPKLPDASHHSAIPESKQLKLEYTFDCTFKPCQATSAYCFVPE